MLDSVDARCRFRLIVPSLLVGTVPPLYVIYCYVLLCTVLYYFVLLCYVPLCTVLYSYVLLSCVLTCVLLTMSVLTCVLLTMSVLTCVPYLRLLYLLISSHYNALRTRLVPYPSHKRSCAFAWVNLRLFVPLVSALLVCASARCSSRDRPKLDLVYKFFYQTVTSRYF